MYLVKEFQKTWSKKLHGERDKSTNVSRELNLADRISRQNISKDVGHLNNTIDQPDLIDIYRKH